MALPRSRLVYIAAVLVSGIVIGFAAMGRPDWQHAALPPVMWPIGVSLVLDLVIGQMAAQGRAEPLTMGDRLVAVLGAGLIVFAMMALGA
jgi:hypothetical protein